MLSSDIFVRLRGNRSSTSDNSEYISMLERCMSLSQVIISDEKFVNFSRSVPIRAIVTDV